MKAFSLSSFDVNNLDITGMKDLYRLIAEIVHYQTFIMKIMKICL